MESEAIQLHHIACVKFIKPLQMQRWLDPHNNAVVKRVHEFPDFTREIDIQRRP